MLGAHPREFPELYQRMVLVNIPTIKVDTMIEDAGVLIEEQRVRSQQATASRSAGDYPYTGFDHLILHFCFI